MLQSRDCLGCDSIQSDTDPWRQLCYSPEIVLAVIYSV